jgi:hypothetical protein
MSPTSHLVQKRNTYAALFLLLGQQKRRRPRRLGWAFSRRRDFGVDPLIDRRGQRMRWAGRLKPRKAPLANSSPIAPFHVQCMISQQN